MNAWCRRHDMPRSVCDCSRYDEPIHGATEQMAAGASGGSSRGGRVSSSLSFPTPPEPRNSAPPPPFICSCFNRDFQKSADELNAKCGSHYTAEDFCGWHVDLCMNTSCGIKKPSTVDDYADLGRRSFPQHLLEWEEQASYDSQGRL
jgi:hypothetical protein